jgi:phospholipid/cholesterol/gamma-HCH transport system substrate-binding protein
MTQRRIILAPLVTVLAILVGLLALGGKSHGYHVTVLLGNADGLRQASPVTSGGVTIGTISALELGPADQVQARVTLDPGHAPIGAGATAAIKAKNLLGEKYLELSPGDRSRPEPSGAVIPSSAVTTPVDLDQVLDVLDPGTRADLSILLNEAGESFNGRRGDVSALLAQLPPSLEDATHVLQNVIEDNHTLADLIHHAERFISTFAPQRAQLGQLVTVAGQTATTVAERDSALRATLAKAPATLSALQGFLSTLQRASQPLGPAARLLTATAPVLSGTLQELTPFQRAAQPTLGQARAVAPQLTALGEQATPVLAQATPTLGSLATLAGALPHLSNTLGLTSDDLMAILQGWSRAIQARDGLTHMFRAKVNFNMDTLRDAILRLEPPQTTHGKARPVATPPANAGRPTPGSAPSRPTVPPLPGVVQQVSGIVQEATGAVQQLTGTVQQATGAVGQTLNGLTQSTQAGSAQQSSGSSNQTASATKQLLDYLFGP